MKKFNQFQRLIARRHLVEQLMTATHDKDREGANPIIQSIFRQAEKVFSEKEITHLREWMYAERAKSLWQGCTSESLRALQADLRQKLRASEQTTEAGTFQEPFNIMTVCCSLQAIAEMVGKEAQAGDQDAL